MALTIFMQHERLSPMNRIDSVSELVAAFGGTGAMAEWLDVGSSTVSNWKALGYIPRSYHFMIYLECKERGIELEPSAFGLKNWPIKSCLKADSPLAVAAPAA